MHYTPQYRDRTTKAEAVQANTVDMMAEFIRNRLLEAGFSTRNVDSSMGETRDILREWVERHPDATLEAVSDQLSDMVRDLLEDIASGLRKKD